MRWELTQPSLGDIVRVHLGGIYHYGIYVSDDEVIQFGLAPSARRLLPDSEICVLASDIDVFLAGGFLEVSIFDRKEKRKHRSPKETVKIARSRIGERGYHILYNNCEHFAYECLTGEKYSSQTESVRKLFQSMPMLDVYIAEIPADIKIGAVSPKSRQDEISACSCERVKREKYCAWKLLEYGLQRSLGKKLADMEIAKSENGKWTSPHVEFSISHSHDAVCVAVSRKPVGVDIELLQSKINTERFCDRILTDGETAEYGKLTDNKLEFLLTKWSQKESLFKQSGGKSFLPKEQDTQKGNVISKTVNVAGQKYILSVASDTPEKLRVFENIKLV